MKQIEEIFVFGDPQVCVIGFGSKQFDIFRIFDMLVERKWLLNSLQFPARYDVTIYVINAVCMYAFSYVKSNFILSSIAVKKDLLHLILYMIGCVSYVCQLAAIILDFQIDD